MKHSSSMHYPLIPRVSVLLTAFLTPLLGLRAEVRPAPLFQNNAVLQQGKPVPVWGKADAGEKVTVEFAGQKKETTADSEGRWKVTLDPLATSSTPAEMIISGTNTLRLSNIVVGEVWLCSGQSNMEWTVARSMNAEQEIAEANYPMIRHFKTPRTAAEKPADTVEGEWAVCSPQTVENFSAAAYFFAREIHKALGVPVGLINTSWGGTQIESWISEDTLKNNPNYNAIMARWKERLEAYPEALKKYEAALEKWKSEAEEAKAAGREFTRRAPSAPEGEGSRWLPSSLFNAMVHPFIPYAIEGFLWYQGETNAVRHEEYASLFKDMITQWRRDFGQGDLPFYFVQLANFKRKDDTTGMTWAYLREAQMEALSLPNTGAAVIIDIGDPDDIHPTNKQGVGDRLARLALTHVYKKSGIVWSGPVFEKATIQGNSVRLDFSHADGLKLADGDPTSFELAGADGVFHPAQAKVEGTSVIVSSPEVANPVEVRYAWANNPRSTLSNGAGLPASPFRAKLTP